MPITHRDPETVTTSAGRAPAGQSSNLISFLARRSHNVEIHSNVNDFLNSDQEIFTSLE